MKTSHCTCKIPSEYNCPSNSDAYDRHELDCKCCPDVSRFWWYPQFDGELGNGGGIYVNPDDLRTIYLEINGYLCPVPRIDSEDCLEGAWRLYEQKLAR